MQPKHAVDGAHFGGLDEFGMRNGAKSGPSSDFSQNARKPSAREIWKHIVVLQTTSFPTMPTSSPTKAVA
jgi:hypothetical protein